MGDSSLIDVINLVILWTAFLAYLVALGELFTRDKKLIHYVSVALYLLFGTGLLIDHINCTPRFESYPYFAYVNDVIQLAAGTAFYFYLKALLSPNSRIERKEFLLLIPSALSLILYLPLFLQSARFKLVHYHSGTYGDLPFQWAYRIINHNAQIWIIFVVLLAFYRTKVFSTIMRSSGVDRMETEQKVELSLYAMAWIFAAGLYLYAQWSNGLLALRFAMLLASGLGILLFIIRYRYRNLLDGMRKDLSASKYKRSRLHGIDTAAVLERLNDLMDYEKAFTDEAMSLAALSQRLDVTPHQLSELLNKELNTNFNGYINRYRVDLARKMLLEKKDYSIIRIAYECGFNSKTTFNTTFVRHTGVTPSQYRNGAS